MNNELDARMNWISENEIKAIRSRVRGQKFPKERTRIYHWYVRFVSFALGILSAIPFVVDREPKWAFLTILWLVLSYQQHLNWRHFQEQYVLSLELLENKNVEQELGQVSSESALPDEPST